MPDIIDTTDPSLVSYGADMGAAYAANELNKASDLWATMEAKAEEEAKKVGAIAAGASEVVFGVALVLNMLGATALSGFLTSITSAILIDVGLLATGTVATGAMVGSVIPGIGSVIGLVVGALIALGEVIGYSCSIQITDGRKYNCSDYINNLKAMGDWLNSGVKVVGVTPLWCASKFGLFLASPLWLYANQRQLGISQPPPPDPGSDTGKIYGMPGAFELLNKPQLLAAAQLVTGTPSQLGFWMSIPKPGPIVPNPDQTWADVDFGNTGAVGMPGDNYGKYAHRNYQAPPGLFTRYAGPPDGTPQDLGIAAAQGALGFSGIYALQIAFPSLTKSQCQLIFDKARPAYEQIIHEATVYVTNFAAARWDHLPPQASDLGPGTKWNLAAVDVDAIRAPFLAAAAAQDAQNSAANDAANIAAWQAVFGHAAPAAPTAVFKSSGTFGWQGGPLDLSGMKGLGAINIPGLPPGWTYVKGPTGALIATPPLSLGQAQGILGAAAGGDPTAAGYLAGVAGSANSGHPGGIAAAEMLTVAQKLGIVSKFVAKYVGPKAAALIRSGLHLTVSKAPSPILRPPPRAPAPPPGAPRPIFHPPIVVNPPRPRPGLFD